MSDNHGNTPAAWTAVAVALVGFVVGAAGLMLDPISYLLFWVGVGLNVAAGLLFVAMSKLGLHESDHESRHESRHGSMHESGHESGH